MENTNPQLHVILYSIEKYRCLIKKKKIEKFIRNKFKMLENMTNFIFFIKYTNKIFQKGKNDQW